MFHVRANVHMLGLGKPQRDNASSQNQTSNKTKATLASDSSCSLGSAEITHTHTQSTAPQRSGNQPPTPSNASNLRSRCRPRRLSIALIGPALVRYSLHRIRCAPSARLALNFTPLRTPVRERVLYQRSPPAAAQRAARPRNSAPVRGTPRVDRAGPPWPPFGRSGFPRRRIGLQMRRTREACARPPPCTLAMHAIASSSATRISIS